jgi:hypothetical protein
MEHVCGKEMELPTPILRRKDAVSPRHYIVDRTVCVHLSFTQEVEWETSQNENACRWDENIKLQSKEIHD